MGISSISNMDWSVYMKQYGNSKVGQSTSTGSTSDTAGISRSSGNLANVTATNSDGDTVQLSAEALSAAEMFSKMDTDTDGSLSLAEFSAARPADVTEEMAQNLYNSFDTDSSGSLAESEYTTAMKDAPPPPPPAGASASGASSETETFDSLDTNKDGVVSLEELAAAKPKDVSEEMAAQLFNSLDSDTSGDLSAEELSAMSANAAANGASAV